MHVRIQSSWMKHLDFIVADLVCLNIAFILAYFFRVRSFYNMYALAGYRLLIIVAMILHFCIIFFTNYYSGILRRGYLQEAKKVLIHNIELTGALFAFLFLEKISNSYSRIVVTAFFVFDSILMYLVHIVLKKIQKSRNAQKWGDTNLLVCSTPRNINKIIEQLTNGPDKSYNIAGIVLSGADPYIRDIQGIPVVADESTVYEFVCRNIVDHVLLDMDYSQGNNIEEIANTFIRIGITVHINLNGFLKDIPNAYFGKINDARVVTTSINTMSQRDIILKRLIDILAGIVGCIITGILFIFLAPAIKISDPKGPVFFGQERVGRNGRKFKIYKFRSMYADAEERKKELMKDNKMEGLMFKIDEDPRILGSGPDGKKKGLGHFMRSLSLDEFPNFWSILKGDMSLVGTRPPTMDEYEKYEFHHKSRLAMKPGLTGMWQVSGRSDITDFEEIVKLDNEYITNWSLGLDIKIIWKTIGVVLLRKGSV